MDLWFLADGLEGLAAFWPLILMFGEYLRIIADFILGIFNPTTPLFMSIAGCGFTFSYNFTWS